MLNAAIWLGATFFCAISVPAALNSSDMVNLVGAKYFTQISGALAQIIFDRLCHLQTACALIAGLHLLGEWLYLGRQPQRGRVILLTGLFTLALLGGLWLGTKLTRLHRTVHAPGARAEVRAAAEQSFQWWQRGLQMVNGLMIGGVMIYFWRVARTDDAPRFVRPANFHS